MQTLGFIFGTAILAGVFPTLVQIAGTLRSIDRDLPERSKE